jgi:hypothetical protein
MGVLVAAEAAVDLIGQAPLERADGFLLGVTFLESAVQVGTTLSTAAGLGDRDPV